jgi:hypothetical protein
MIAGDSASLELFVTDHENQQVGKKSLEEGNPL